MNRSQWAHGHNQASIGIACGNDRAFDLSGITQANRRYLDTERWRHSLKGSQLPPSTGRAWITNNDRTRHTRCNLLKQFKPFSTDAKLK
jgi:hypothetical protein